MNLFTMVTVYLTQPLFRRTIVPKWKQYSRFWNNCFLLLQPSMHMVLIRIPFSGANRDCWQLDFSQWFLPPGSCMWHEWTWCPQTYTCVCVRVYIIWNYINIYLLGRQSHMCSTHVSHAADRKLAIIAHNMIIALWQHSASAKHITNKRDQKAND